MHTSINLASAEQACDDHFATYLYKYASLQCTLFVREYFV